MAEKYYSSEQNVQILVSLLKQSGIKKIIASPGTTNLNFVASLQQDDFFEMYSAPEERSGAYMAVGMAEESGEPVVITCTGATASRNYLPALTEAFYRKLPVIAVTATQPIGTVGQLVPQVIDRSTQLNDTATYSVNIRVIKDEKDGNEAIIKINEALHHLEMNGGGPVHINLETSYSRDFSVKGLPIAPKIQFFSSLNNVPPIPTGRIGVFVGSHSKMNAELTKAIDEFCYAYNAAVFCDNTSNYNGHYRFQYPLLLSQDNWKSPLSSLSLLIYIGEISGAYARPWTKEIWRVSEDGFIRSVFGIPSVVFKTSEIDFFKYYAGRGNVSSDSFVKELNDSLDNLYNDISEKDLPFSNIWIAEHTSSLIPRNSVVHFGILNSLRSWNFFRLPAGTSTYSNVGGFGIDGALSTVIGGALAQPDKIHFCVLGDLAFFYDLSSLGNRHLPSNLRILLVNNGLGTEFRNYNHLGYTFGDDADKFIAAEGHYGQRSPVLIKHFAQDLGFDYISAFNKDDYKKAVAQFVDSKFTSKPLLFEVFTERQNENDALHLIRNLRLGGQTLAQNMIRKVVGPKGVQSIKKIIRK